MISGGKVALDAGSRAIVPEGLDRWHLSDILVKDAVDFEFLGK